MKNQSIFVMLTLLVISLSAMAKEGNPPTSDTTSCAWLQWYYDAPHFFCECEYGSHTFAFPVDTTISDTVWFTATIDDLRKGISAYWFADCSVVMEVYAMCLSNQPTIVQTVAPNKMREMDVSDINKKLDEMEDMAFLKALTPHIRVYPKNHGSGHVYCYPYDQGPHSTCENPLPLFAGMTYVCNHPENVYRMDASQIPESGQSFIVWKQKKNEPAQVWLTIDNCDGEEIGRAELTDSLHVYQPDASLLQSAKAEGRDLWLHIAHEEGIVGRLEIYTNPAIVASGDTIEKTTCLGKTQKLNQRIYSTDTTFVDTIRIKSDTLQTTPVKFAFTQPTIIYDTVHVDAATLGRGYRHTATGVVLFEYGDTIVDIVKENTCTRRYQITVTYPEAVEDVRRSDVQCTKVIENGQLFILLDDRKYNVFGQPIINNK